MLEIVQRECVTNDAPIDEVVILDHEQRKKGRIKTVAESGVDVGFFLQRGKTLQPGSVLRTQCGKSIQIQGAIEAVSTATCDSWSVFSAACYHLGNRHTNLQIGERWLRFKPDHVLEDLVIRLGLKVSHEQAVFEPVDGAYRHSEHSHQH